jgi:hypothetical protein
LSAGGVAHAEVSHAVTPMAATDWYAANVTIRGGLRADTKVYSIVVTNNTVHTVDVKVTSKTTEGTLENAKTGKVAPGGDILLFTNEKDYKFVLTLKVTSPSITGNGEIAAYKGKETARKDGFKVPGETGWFSKDVELSKAFKIKVESPSIFERVLTIVPG